ncbi:MAG TPA: GDSL-type esterase/lipase family protein [Bryobacteraceae bacterium]|nr:GDSL-type esterase/lipase family protein [Bryobacteraceae bacterium]
MRWLACIWAATTLALAQNSALLPNHEALALEQRTLQLMESTGLAVPGLVRAGAPALEDARQTFANLQTAPHNAVQTYNFLTNARAYLAIAETVPKPYPFPDEARRQFGELRDSVDRLDSHFRALLDSKEAELRNPDRDDLKRYAEADQRLGPPSPQRPRVVFLGDSITDGWRLNEYYGGDHDFINRGISGQTTGEMLGRTKADVIDLKPQAVLILAGTNDLARGVPIRTIENNLSMIADLVEAHNIKPLFASLLPVSDYHKDVNPQFARTIQRPPSSIVEINNWLKGFCEQRRLPYVDYYAALIDQNGYLQADASDDGLHPNAKGYRLMSPIALAAIDRVTLAATKPSKKRVRAAANPPQRPAAVAEVKTPAPAAADKAASPVQEQAKPQAAGKKQADAEKPADDKKKKKKGGIKAWLTRDHQ